MKTCPPCHGFCDQGRTCPAEFHPAYDSWKAWFVTIKTGIEANRFMFVKSSHGKAYRAGWDAATNHQKDNDSWKTFTNDQA